MTVSPEPTDERSLHIDLFRGWFIHPYAMPRDARITARWHVGHWRGHLRLLTPWRVFGVVYR